MKVLCFSKNQSQRLLKQTRLQKQMTEMRRKLLKKKLSARVRSLLNGARYVSVAFVDEKTQKRLNHQFRKKNKVTDVLSFAPVEAASLGELSICFSVIRKDAKKNKILVSEQLLYILIHGFLHLLGYDHENDDKSARRMYALQDQLFEEMRIKWES